MPCWQFAQLNKFVSEWEKDPELKGSLTSYCVYDVQSKLRIAEHNANLFMIPASTLKIVTTAAALRQLGNNFKFKTRIAYTGKLNKETGVLDGDLIILGGGDPSLQSEYFSNKEPKPLTDQWAQIIKDAGIKEIKGKIIGDASVWDHKIPGNWIWGDIGNYFGAVPCGLSFMDNQFKLFFTTKEEGSNAKLSDIHPVFLKEKLSIENAVKAKGSSDEAYVFGDPLGYNKTISGFLPPNKSGFEVKASLPDPAFVCAEYLLRSLKQIGVICHSKQAESKYTKQDSSLQTNVIHTHYSPSLEKIIQITNVASNNLFAETLLLALGNGNTYAGFEAIKKYLNSQKLDAREINLSDGSGLSRANLITTALQAELLMKIWEDNFIKTAFYNSLPIAGKQGSMTNIGKGRTIENNMRAKTGYISNARGYCGYVKTKTGKELAFSVLFNNYRCNPKAAKLKIEKFLIELGEL